MSEDLVDFTSGCILASGSPAHFVHKSLNQRNPKAIWLQTSGSTGKARWLSLSNEGILEAAKSVCNKLQVTRSDVWGLFLPTYHVGGLSILARAHVSGCSLLRASDDKIWNPQQCFQQMQKEKCSIVSFVPTQLYDLISLNFAAPDSLRTVLLGGASIDKTLLSKAQELGWPVHLSYGLSESSAMFAHALPLADAPVVYEVLPHISYRVNGGGNLELKGNAVIQEYALFEESEKVCYQDPKQDGWYTTSDKVKLEKGGFSWQGRSNRQIKILGSLVDLDEVERELQRTIDFPTVLIEHADARRGYELYAYVETNQALSLEVINAQLVGLHRLARIITVQKLPRLHNQKIDIQALKSRVK